MSYCRSCLSAYIRTLVEFYYLHSEDVLVFGLQPVYGGICVLGFGFGKLGGVGFGVFVFARHEREVLFCRLFGHERRAVFCLGVYGVVVSLLDFLVQVLFCLVEHEALRFVLQACFPYGVARGQAVEYGYVE